MLQEDNADTPITKTDDDGMMDVGARYVVSGLEEIRKSAKQLIQLSWYDITIKATPPASKCCKSHNANNLTKEKIIIDNVSGTVQPGQFLAIIGASGKFCKSVSFIPI